MKQTDVSKTLELIELQSKIVVEVSKLLGEAVKSEVPDAAERLEAAIAILSGKKSDTSDKVPASNAQFAEAYSGKHCKLEVRSSGRLGREVRLTIYAGSSYEKAFDEINQESQKRYGRVAIYKGVLYNDHYLIDILQRTLVFTFTPVVNNSSYKVKYGDASQDVLLKDNRMNWVHKLIITAATGAFRVAKGFPKDAADIGSETDSGDLLMGLVVRANDGVVISTAYGVDFYWEKYCDEVRYNSVVAAGSY
jgi:hypothetical protein